MVESSPFWYVNQRYNEVEEPMDALDFEENFTYHPPRGTQEERYERIRAGAMKYAKFVDSMTPNSAEKTIALRKLQEVVFWLNAAIAINESD